MKLIYAILILLFTSIGHSQSLSDIKYDSIVKIENTDLSLVYLKKKTAVWHDANFFVAQPTKNYFIFLEAAQLLVEVDFKHKSFYAIVQDQITGGYKRFFLASDGFEADIYLDYPSYKEILKIDTSFYNKSLTKKDNFNTTLNIGEVGLYISKENFYIRDYKVAYQIEKHVPIESIRYSGEDSINDFGEIVYYPLKEIKRITNSGIYNTKKKKYVLPRNYEELYYFKNKVLLSLDSTFHLQKFHNNHKTYQLVELNKNNYTIIKDSIVTNNPSFIPQSVNFDSIVNIENSFFSIIYGDQTAVVHQLRKEYICPPSNHHFIFFKSVDFFMEIDLETDSIFAIIDDQFHGRVERKFVGETNFKASVIFGRPLFEYDNYLCYNDSIYNFSLNRLYKSYCQYSPNGDGEIGVSIVDELIIIKDYKKSKLIRQNEYDIPTPLKSLEFPDQDSTYNNETVYPYYSDTVFGIQNSGVYNTITNLWTIPRNFSKIENNNTYFLTSIELDKKNLTLDSNKRYNLFDMNSNKFIKKNKTTNDRLITSVMTDYNSIQQLDDKVHYITYKNGKQGLIEFQLFDEYISMENIYEKHLSFTNRVIAEPKYDFIYFSCQQNLAITRTDNLYSIHQNLDGTLITRDSLVYWPEMDINNKAKVYKSNIKKSAYLNINYDGLPNYKFGLDQINDSLIIITDFISEYQENYPFVDEEGYDSLDINGYVVYPPTEPGQYHCGLYNLNQNKWTIEPNEYDIQYYGGNSIVIEKPEFDEHRIIKSLEHKSIYDLNGEFVISNQSTEELITKKEILEKILLQYNETIENYNIGYYSNTNIPDTLNYAPYYYKIKSQNKERIVKVDYSGTDNISDYHYFVIYEPQSKFHFYLDDNGTNISFSIMEDSIETQQIEVENYKLEIYTVLDYEYMLSSLVILTTDKDTTLYEFGLKSEGENLNLIEDYKSRTKRIITITKVNNEIIYNVSSSNGSLHASGDDYYDIEYGGENDIVHDWEQEYSSVYRKTNYKWIKASPNYSSIEKVNFGYLCKTGKYNYTQYSNFEHAQNSNIKSTYILLDSTLKSIGYSDFYNFDLIEDLGFGLKICPVIDKEKWNTVEGQSNCFFVDYNGKALCDTKYDRFELVNGKIYGIRDEVFKTYEETGELEYEEYSDAILLQKYERILIGEFEE